MDAGKFIAGIYYSLLPQQWWRGWRYASTADFARSATVCGLAEMGLFGWLTLQRFGHHMVARSKLVADVGMNEGTQLWVLAVFIADFLIQLVSLVLIYFTLEGFARGYNAWLHDQVLPTLPLSLLARWQQKSRAATQEKALGERVRDFVERQSDGELRIASCRPKDWTISTTISYEDQMWELAKSEELQGPRRYVYRLKLRSSSVPIRALRKYDPEEVLR